MGEGEGERENILTSLGDELDIVAIDDQLVLLDGRHDGRNAGGQLHTSDVLLTQKVADLKRNFITN